MFKFKDETTLFHRLRRAHIQKEISVADVVVFMVTMPKAPSEVNPS